MDLNRTPTLRLHLTANEVLNRNFRRIDDAFAAKAASQPLPKSPIDVIYSTPTIGLARTGNADLNHDFNLIDALFSATPPTHGPFRFTSDEMLNRNLNKIIVAFIAAAIPVPPDPVPATGATAGSPGAFTPAGSIIPPDFPELLVAGITASPTTAWTLGQFVILGDLSLAHWSGTAWVVGQA
jgi:hypothetical protein